MKKLLIAMITLSINAFAADYKVSCSNGQEILGQYTVPNAKGLEVIIESLIERNVNEGFNANHAPTISTNQKGVTYICVTSTK